MRFVQGARWGFLLGALLLGLGALAKGDDKPTIVLKAHHLFDGVSGRLQSDGTVIVQQGRIVAVGRDAKIPPGARMVDLGDATILPGFIDAHVHIADESSTSSYRDFYDGMLRYPAEQAFYAERYAGRTLRAGFTTIRVLGSADWIDISLRNAIDAGLVQGPRILAAAHAIGSPGGHCDQAPFPPDRVRPQGPIEGICSGPESCREAVRDQMKWGADVIKICASGGVFSESDPLKVPQLTAAELEAIIGEAHRWGRKVAAHAHGDEAARLAIEAGVDSIEHGSFLTPETLELMKERGVYLVPTRMAPWWLETHADDYPPAMAKKGRMVGEAHAAMLRNAIRIGTPIAFGTDSSVTPHGMNAKEFSLMVALGMSPTDALLSATREGARLLGIADETGTVEVGKSADLVVVRGNPLEHIEATEHPIYVMSRGLEIPLTP